MVNAANAIALRSASRPILDTRSDDDILGYNEPVASDNLRIDAKDADPQINQNNKMNVVHFNYILTHS
jgi:hypothetical protein